MAVRNSQELGENLVLIMRYLCENNNLKKLLKYTDKNPLSPDLPNISTAEIINKNIKVVPLVNNEEDTTESTVVLLFPRGSVTDNKDFKQVALEVLVYVPIVKWIVNDESLRPFLIMSEIEKSLKGKKINGLGTITYLNFDLSLISDLMSCYKMEFYIDTYN